MAGFPPGYQQAGPDTPLPAGDFLFRNKGIIRIMRVGSVVVGTSSPLASSWSGLGAGVGRWVG